MPEVHIAKKRKEHSLRTFFAQLFV